MTPRKAFTLVEILIVVVILGILAAVITPNLASATDEAAENTAYSELMKVRRAIDVYLAKYKVPPEITVGDQEENWGQIVSPEFLKTAPRNPWVGTANSESIAHGDRTLLPTTAAAWIYDPNTGDIWAGGFNADDTPAPR